jgi:hypothetical protein
MNMLNEGQRAASGARFAIEGWTKAYEVPSEMRDFAEKSVEQARKAFEDS